MAVLVEVVNALYLRAGRVKPAGPRRGQLARLEDSLALVLCISRDNAQRYDRACARLLVRLQQAVAVPFDQRERIHSALKALPRDRDVRAAALDDLEQVLAACGLAACAQVVGAYRDRQPPAASNA